MRRITLGMKKLIFFLIFLVNIVNESVSFAQDSNEGIIYSIPQNTFSPQVGISTSQNYKIFANSSSIIGFTPKMPDGYSNISGLLKVFPSTIAPTIDFDNSTKLFIRENQAVGQVVVQFTPSGTSNITNLNFVQGEGDKHNSLFTLDANGTLRSAVVFDFETSDSFLSIRILANGAGGSKIEKSFSIELINIIEDLDSDGIEDHFDIDIDGDGYSNEEEIAYGSNPIDANSFIQTLSEESNESFRPIVSTSSEYLLEGDILVLNGKVLDTGQKDSTISRGFILSSNPIPDTKSQNYFVSEGRGTVGTFSESFEIGNLRKHSLYFRTFAKNIKGISYGETFHVVLNEGNKLFSWAEVTSESSIDGWWRSSWFGTFYAPNETGWILHEDLSWIFILAQPNNRGVWLWKSDLGWLWTNKSSFGHLFSHSSQSWFYLHGSTKSDLLLFDYDNRNWLVLKKI